MVVPGSVRGGLRGIRLSGFGIGEEKGGMRKVFPARKTKRGREIIPPPFVSQFSGFSPSLLLTDLRLLSQ